MGIRPKNYMRRIDNLDYQFVENKLQEIETAISDFVQTLPTHDQFIRDRFRAM
jgi:hypothetical protein